MDKGNFKKLIRNLRKKSYEKVHFIRNASTFNNGKESKKNNIQSEKDNNIREK